MKTMRGCFFVVAGALLAGWLQVHAASPAKIFRAGAFAMDVTPTNFPVIVNGGFLSQTADKAQGRLHVRWLVLDDGKTRVALGVLDTCVIPGEFADAVRTNAAQATGIPVEHIMLSATHTHSAPSLMRCLGTEADPDYPAFALPRIVEGLSRALAQLAPARVGWAVAQAPKHTNTRVWIRRPDKLLTDPFGELTVRANMHPGHQNPDTLGPSGPSDPEVTLLAVCSPSDHPMAVLANYSMHYFGAPAVSADYYGLFAEKRPAARVPPGAKLNEGELARALGITRTPIREAINRLEKEGLVEIFPQRGAFVVQFTEKNVYELFLIRENLEGLAARLAAGKITPASLGRLESCLEGFKEPFREKDVQRYSREDFKFHQTIVLLSDARRLIQLVSALHDYIRMFRLTTLGMADRMKTSLADHGRILEALRKKDPEEAEAVPYR